MLTEREKMTNGDSYKQFDPELQARRKYIRQELQKINAYDDNVKSNEHLAKLFGDCGKNLFIETGVEFDYGYNIHIGDEFYANYHLTLLDTCPITIGNHCYFGPDVGLYTPVHPLDPKQRLADVELGKPITIGNNCWMGGHVTILPGVTLGDNVVVGAGSVVTKSFGDNVVIVGNPAKVIKTID
ncbi:sugar O-acetyltransferase [Apilactobacillus xinyiensis]|uniref:sugar O-acetyltransferase n=1 Tax=Apilactobacillus xinyiensis TaxID=2841032 RepID=UPI0020109BA7|nr:sugar O-acetyltransferase [Apilactobacillus xinyiensis]MCL0330384.1 sugar O-acetyltransferase [Apilactobacillus xinyiensis]